MQGRIVDVDALLTGHVHAALAELHPARTIEVAPERPAGTDWARDRPTLVVVSSGGGPGPRAVVIQDVTFVAEVYAPDRVEAFDLAADLVGIIAALPGVRDGFTIYHAALDVPRSLPDPLTGYPRFVAAGTLSCRLAGT